MPTNILTIDLDTRSYDIYIGKALLFRINDFLPEEVIGKSVFIVTDKNVDQYAQHIEGILRDEGGASVHKIVLPAGERTKSFSHVEQVCSFFLDNRIHRSSLVMAVGGGVIGDLAGFCASVAMRGVPYIQVPTTLLSQVDSSVGGKTGINTAQGKNLVGSFYQPKAVIADIETLQTLPKRELLAGYAEVVKYGLIRDAGFFQWLEKHYERVLALDEEALAHIIGVSCEAKAEVVQADEQEHGQRALLNLGHTFGHALEAAAGYDGILLHGEAVAIGTVIAYNLGQQMGTCDEEDVERVIAHFEAVGLPTRAAYVDALETSVDALMEIMRGDKKVKDGQMHFVVPNGIGEASVRSDVDAAMVRSVLIESLGGEVKEKSTKGGQWASTFSSLS